MFQFMPSGKNCETSIRSEITTIYQGNQGNATLYTKVTKMDVGHISKHPQRSISGAFLNDNETTLYTTLSPKMETLSEVDDSLLRLTSKAHSTGTSLPTRDLHSTTLESSATPSIPSVSITFFKILALYLIDDITHVSISVNIFILN